MRLAGHSLHCYRLRYERPVRWSDIVEEAAPFVLLRLQSDTGAVGVAEITVKPTWCGVTAKSLIATIGPFLPGPLPTIVAFAVWGVALAALTVIGLRGQARNAMAIAVLGTAMGLLFAPHILPYDAVLLLVPAWLVAVMICSAGSE